MYKSLYKSLFLARWLTQLLHSLAISMYQTATQYQHKQLSHKTNNTTQARTQIKQNRQKHDTHTTNQHKQQVSNRTYNRTYKQPAHTTQPYITTLQETEFITYRTPNLTNYTPIRTQYNTELQKFKPLPTNTSHTYNHEIQNHLTTP